MRQVWRDRGGMCEQCNAPAFEWRAQSGFGDKSIIAKFHGRYAFRKIEAQRIRNDGNLPCPVDAPAPNMIYGRSYLRSPPRDQFAIPRRFAGSTSDPFPARLAICSTSGSIAPQCGARLSRLQQGSRFGSYRTDMLPIVLRAQS